MIIIVRIIRNVICYKGGVDHTVYKSVGHEFYVNNISNSVPTLKKLLPLLYIDVLVGEIIGVYTENRMNPINVLWLKCKIFNFKAKGPNNYHYSSKY
jgi:hypothetical protein